MPLCIPVYDWDPVSSARSPQRFGGKNNYKKKNLKRQNGVTAVYNAFPSHKLKVAFGNTVTLSTLKQIYPWPLTVPVRDGFTSFTDEH